jgi:hypothetical protein
MAILVGAAAKCLWARWLAGEMFRGGGMLCSAITKAPAAGDAWAVPVPAGERLRLYQSTAAMIGPVVDQGRRRGRNVAKVLTRRVFQQNRH